MTGFAIERLIRTLSRLPGLGPRSARRVALALVKKRELLMEPLMQILEEVSRDIRLCSICGNLDTVDPCSLCTDPKRDPAVLCVVQEIADLWALERAGVFRGRYHVLGGVLSALDKIGPNELHLNTLVTRVTETIIHEVILALGTTIDGQITANTIAELLKDSKVIVSSLARGVPMGGELDYLDDGTIITALQARQPMHSSTLPLLSGKSKA